MTWLVYLSHFVVTLTVAVVLWVRAYPLLPTVPRAVPHRHLRRVRHLRPLPGDSRRGSPASAATCPHTVRIVREDVARASDSTDIAKVFGEKSNYAFPVGALPSLHAAWPFMIMLFFWSRSPGRWRILLVVYTLAMAFTLVYTADHFVFDILLGWTYVIVVVYVGFSWFWRRQTSCTTSQRRGYA